ncbi:hypothetical protein RCL1_003529 [Eukaryota sp. TZLM3-RCL]
MLDYSDNVKFWNSRYRTDPSFFDWYFDVTHCSSFKDELSKHIPLSSTILIAGNGTSRLPFQLSKMGYSSLVSLDFSPVSIEIMNSFSPSLQGVAFQLGDLRNIPFPPSHFDAVIDKATLDSMFCSAKAKQNVDLYLSQVFSVLKTGSVYISISFLPPSERSSLFPAEKWELEVVEIPKVLEDSTGSFFVYIAKKI